MTLSTLPRYLIGRESAILEVIESRGVLLLGFLFVLSAGFAREYDGEDLMAEPWHLLIPLVASVGSCAILYALLLAVARRNKEYPLRPLERFWRFLGLYWMTAPLAWVYAIPVEQWLSPAQAMEVNLNLLAIVALWRVLLISRAAAVLFGTKFWKTIFPVILFGDVVMLVIVSFIHVPVFIMMGGVRLTPTESVLQNAKFLTQFWGTLTLPLWVGGTAIGMGLSGEEKGRWKPLLLGPRIGGISPWLWGLAAISLLVWIPILPLTQPPQQLKHEVDTLLKRGNVEQAVRRMSAHNRSDFPPGWDPAPRVAEFGNFNPPLHVVLRATREPGTAPWVRELYVDKVARQFESPYGTDWGSLADDPFAEYAAALGELPADAEAVKMTAEVWNQLLGRNEFSDERREVILDHFAKWGIQPPPPPSAPKTVSEPPDSDGGSPDATPPEEVPTE